MGHQSDTLGEISLKIREKKMKKLFGFLIFLIPTIIFAKPIETLMETGYEIKSSFGLSSGGMILVLQNGKDAYVCPALDPTKIRDCIKVKSESDVK